MFVFLMNDAEGRLRHDLNPAGAANVLLTLA